MKDSIHHKGKEISVKVEGLFHVIPFKPLRHTANVDFQIMSFFEEFNGVDVVKHEPGARSPGAVNNIGNYRYMHPHQEDNLITLHGNRFVELYTPAHGVVEQFEISYERITRNGKVILDGPGILGRPTNVFHRNFSPEGSMSMNFAVRNDDFDINTEFNIYDIDTDTGKYKVVRLGKLDQPK